MIQKYARKREIIKLLHVQNTCTSGKLVHELLAASPISASHPAIGVLGPQICATASSCSSQIKLRSSSSCCESLPEEPSLWPEGSVSTLMGLLGYNPIINGRTSASCHIMESFASYEPPSKAKAPSTLYLSAEVTL